jgi:hypothetical protein
MQFFKGFAESAQAAQLKDMELKQQQRSNSIQPPPGWLSVSPIQKLNRKYDPAGNITPWYQQGMVFDESLSGGSIQQAVSSYRPVAMENTVQGQRMAQRERSMSDLNKQAENERWDNPEQLSKTPDGQMDLSKAKEVPRSDGAPATINEAIKQEQQLKQPDEEVKATEVLKEIGGKLMEDNQKYLGMFIEYIKSRPIDQFEKDLENAEETIKGFLDKWGWIIPVQTKEMIKRTSYDELKQMVETNAPEKYDLIKKKKLMKKFETMWDELQKKI